MRNPVGPAMSRMNEVPMPAEFDAASHETLVDQQYEVVISAAAERWAGYASEEAAARAKEAELNAAQNPDQDALDKVVNDLARLNRLMRGGEQDATLRYAEDIAQDDIDETMEEYAEQVALRHRQTAPAALFKSPREGYSVAASRRGRRNGGESKPAEFMQDTLFAAQQKHQVALSVAQKVRNAQIEATEPDTQEQERLKKESALELLLGGNGNEGTLFQVNEEIRKVRQLHSGHYELNSDTGEIEKKSGLWHKVTLGFYQRYNDLNDKLIDKLGARKATFAKAGILAGTAAVGTLVAGATGVGLAAGGLVAAGTRLAKSTAVMKAERGSDVLRATKQEETNQQRTETAGDVLRSDQITPDMLSYGVLSEFHTKAANESYIRNRNRVVMTVAAVAGGVVIGKLISLAADADVDMPNWDMPGLPLIENGDFDQPGLPFYENGDFDMPGLPFIELNGDDDREPPIDTTPGDGADEDPTDPPRDDRDPTEPPVETVDIDRDVIVGNGDGYSHVFTDQVEAAADVELTPEQSWDLYTYIDENTAQDGNFFKGKGESYLMDDGNWGITSPGEAEMRAHTERMMQQWILDNEEDLKKAA